jgi:hypothetical protein
VFDGSGRASATGGGTSAQTADTDIFPPKESDEVDIGFVPSFLETGSKPRQKRYGTAQDSEHCTPCSTESNRNGSTENLRLLQALNIRLYTLVTLSRNLGGSSVGNSLSGGLGVRGSMSGPLDDLDFALGLRASGGVGVSAAGGGSGNKVRFHVAASSITSVLFIQFQQLRFKYVLLDYNFYSADPSSTDVSYFPCQQVADPFLNAGSISSGTSLGGRTAEKTRRGSFDSSDSDDNDNVSVRAPLKTGGPMSFSSPAITTGGGASGTPLYCIALS